MSKNLCLDSNRCTNISTYYCHLGYGLRFIECNMSGLDSRLLATGIITFNTNLRTSTAV